MDLVGPAWAVGTTALLFAVSFGFSELIRHTIGRPRAALAGEPSPAQQAINAVPVPQALEPIPWQVRPDPRTQPEDPPAFPAGPGVPLNGDPVLATGRGPYFFDTLARGWTPVADLDPAGVETFPVYDVRTGKPAFAFSKSVPRGPGSLLSRDGRHLVVGFASESKLAVFEPEQLNARAWLAIPGGVYWMDFVGPEELALACGEEVPREVQIWNISQGQKLRSIPLPQDAFPLPMRRGRAPRGPGGFRFTPNPLSGAVSPGKHYLALGGTGGIALLSLEDGRHLGTLPAHDGGSVAYCGVSFSDDGAILAAVLALPSSDQPTSVHLRTWNLQDGSAALNTELADRSARGPLVPGATGDTVWLHRGDQAGGLCVEIKSGMTVAEVPYAPVMRLADGRLLVIGPIRDAPAGTPLPRSAYVDPPDAQGITPEAFRRELKAWEDERRKDPTIRAVYAVALPPP